MMTLAVFFLVLGILIVVHEFGHFFAAKRLNVIVEQFSIGFGPKLVSRKKGETEYSLSAVPFGGYVKLAGDSNEEYQGGEREYLSKKPGERAQIIFCGPLLNYLLGFLCFWFIFFAGYPALTSTVGGLLEGYGAQEAGMRAGDRIVAIDGRPVKTWEELQGAVQAMPADAAVRLRIVRDSAPLDLSVRIKARQTSDLLGKKQTVGLLGITPGEEFVTVRHGFAAAFRLAVGKTWDLTLITYRALGMLVTGRLSMRESVTGPLGIFYITHQAASVGPVAVLHLIAVLSVSLAIFNLLPLPVLDGGHIFFLAVEKVRGRKLSPGAERILNQVGLTLIIMLVLVVTYNDIMKFGGKFLKWLGK